ncbi:MBL fold metallo-hydrolase [Micromonospora sp. NPDC049301]|uniref:MBL fold metallo-hydrolase n=1 Tax=Micromonospora sp. NPDC049301 TaxID=3155723 RepID=UPI003441C126
MSASSRTARAPASAAELVEVADGVHAYTQPNGGWCLNNAGILVGGDGVLVVDTVATEARAVRLRQTVDRLGAGPGRILVNTHHHGDHTFGNFAFGPTATIVAHEQARTEMAATGMALTGLWPDVAWGDVRVVLPHLTFREAVTLHQGDRRVELIHVGPAHTTNDVVAWLPEERVLFAGDVVLAGCTPFNLMGSIEGALRAVARLRRLAPVTVVCGHGPVTGPEVFDRTEAYLRWIQEVAAAGLAAGLTPLEAARDTDLGEFADLLDAERMVGNLHRAYDELRGGEPGRPLDVSSVFAEMVDFNGGRLPDCWA